MHWILETVPVKMCYSKITSGTFFRGSFREGIKDLRIDKSWLCLIYPSNKFFNVL